MQNFSINFQNKLPCKKYQLTPPNYTIFFTSRKEMDFIGNHPKILEKNFQEIFK